MSLGQAYRNLKLKHKLMLLNSLLILISLSILSYMSYKQGSERVNTEVLFSTKQVLEQTDSFLTYKLGKIIEISDSIVLDSHMNDMLSRPVDQYSLSEQLRDFQNLSLNFSSFQKVDDIVRIRLFIHDDLIYSNEEQMFFKLSEFTQSPLQQLLLDNVGKMKWIDDTQAIPALRDPEQKTIHSIRFVKNFSALDDKVGVLNVDIREDMLQEIVKRANTTQNGVAYLQNANGTVIVSSNETNLQRWLLDYPTVQHIASKSDPWQTLSRGGENVLVGSKAIKGTDWQLVTVLPLQEMYSSSAKLRNQTLLIMAILVVAANLCSYVISSSITNRIAVVIRKMRKVQSGELDTVKVEATRDEVGELVENFNYMVGRMKLFIEEQYKLGQEAKNAELKALQSQINPHFLYNTLDLINWTAIKHQVPDIPEIVQALSQFYKISLNKGDELISVENELKHVQLYVDIQNKRFGNSILFHSDVDESLYDCTMLKITLQPIVENAILHGIKENGSRHGAGEIFIHSYMENDTMVLCVEDNGIGMPAEMVDRFNRNDFHDKKEGYGIKNINHRIKLFYGEQYGLHFRSSPGKGTTVEIRMPAVPLEEAI
ncbi:cache domain-containing sensor histidine kinase [Paenibacillus sedimenti]|uniref:histidine kinase n=1 Tax=Paenibacillus sedimenti TaxID=2770274 RepID=A0A926KKV7_9BACL|nr:sensor histidine kinase [Paenibacillus sedimenti]MBD0378993.1 sensor histidine kinase [Paenibacillus sedimenti]